MESLSRPPHRRKHSSALKNHPYEDVLLSNGGGKTMSLRPQEYAEIFAGTSSIPVLDLSSLESGSGGCRSSGRVDYSNIFGGLRNDDVAMPYEELLINASSKTARQQRSPADARSPSQELGSLHSSGRTKGSSGEASDQSTNGVKQQVNLSFNKTNQINKDESDGQIHIAQLHAVPAFTRFVDEVPKPHKRVEDNKNVSSLKREVSHTWSFNAEVEANYKSKGVGLNWDKFHTPEKLQNLNEFDLKSKPSKVPSFYRPSKQNDKMDSRQSKLSSFVSEEDARGKISGEDSPPFLDEELDENSVAAVSAAALKKAIEQAQESIRIAKMIMEKSREGLRDGANSRSKGGSRVKDKKRIWIDHEVVNNSNDKISIESRERSNPILTGVDGKSASSFSYIDPLINTRKAEVERAMENVETAKEHGEAFTVVDKKRFPSLCLDERLRFSGKIEQEKLDGNVVSIEARKEAPTGPGLVPNTESRDVNLMSRLVENINSMLFRNKLASPAEEIESGKGKKERLEVIPGHEEGPCEVSEPASGNLKLNHESPSVIEPSDQIQATLDRSEEPEIVIELLASEFDTSGMRDIGKILEEECEILRTSQEDHVVEENEHATNDKEESRKKFQQSEEMISLEHTTILRSEIHNLMNGSRIEEDLIEKVEMKHITQYVDECRENDERHGDSFGRQENVMSEMETHPNFGSGVKLNVDTQEDINHRVPEVIPPEIEVDMKDNQDHEPEIDEERIHPHDVYREDFPGKLEQMEEIDTNTSESSGTMEIEADNPAEVQNYNVFQNAEDTEVEENHPQCEFQEVIYDKDVDEAVDASSSDMSNIYDEDHHNDRTESCDLDLNDQKEECPNASIGFKEKVTLFSGIDEVKEADEQSHVRGIGMPETPDFGQSDLEANVVGREFQNTDEVDPFDGMNAKNEENLPKDQDEVERADEISEAVEESAAEIQEQTLPASCPDGNETAEFDVTYVGQEFERNSGTDGESVSTSSVDNTDGISVHESEESAEVPEDMDSYKDEIKDDFDMASADIRSVDEQNDAACPELDSEPNNTGKTDRGVATGQNVQKSNENPTGTSKMVPDDAKEKVPDLDKDDHRQRIEAIKKGREREKHKVAAERAVREARERAFAEARERAERAAVEKAAAEARQRAIAEAREKLDKASIEAKIKAERAAVERVTAEALGRAREKAWSQKTSTETRPQVDRSSTEKFTSSSRNNELKHCVSSSDLEAVEGTSTDSAQRQKAKLDKHNRIMERAAKALEEKNMRDRVALQEQAERNRLAQSLDAEVKRWAMGKEGNLRALLSTLQYILGTNSGWQPISLTEIITTAAVKKAYRKATLYVHPDKLQQRGANIQQKYICEKVFDLLKAAWNRFNSEER